MTGAQPRWNAQTKKMEFPKPEPGQAKVSDNSDAYVAIPKIVIVKLAELAKKDGAVIVKAASARGELAQNTRLARPYILALVNDLLESRKGK